MRACGRAHVVTAAPTVRRSGRVAARVENHLPKLRGFRNTEVRVEIAGFLGVRSRGAGPCAVANGAGRSGGASGGGGR